MKFLIRYFWVLCFSFGVSAEVARGEPVWKQEVPLLRDFAQLFQCTKGFDSRSAAVEFLSKMFPAGTSETEVRQRIGDLMAQLKPDARMRPAYGIRDKTVTVSFSRVIGRQSPLRYELVISFGFDSSRRLEKDRTVAVFSFYHWEGPTTEIEPEEPNQSLQPTAPSGRG